MSPRAAPIHGNVASRDGLPGLTWKPVLAVMDTSTIFDGGRRGTAEGVPIEAMPVLQAAPS
jgi:hypothetical protein